MLCDMLWIARLKHEGQGARQLDWLQIAFAGVCEGLVVWAMRQHTVVQAHASRRKPLWFRIVGAVYQPHELRHDVHVIPRRSEGVVRYHPALRKDNEIDVRGTRCLRRRGEHGKDRGIGMIEGDRADGGEGAQVVLIGCVIAVPADYIDRGVRQFGLVQ
jgi:hypothetical protein